MITYIKINGFKSFHNFEMEFTPFTVLAGVNASGKSNLFDALTLLSHMAEMNLKDAFKQQQRGEFIELFMKYGDNLYADRMDFVVEMLVEKEVEDAWGGHEKLKYTRLKYELSIKREINEFDIEDLRVVHERLVNLKHDDDKWIKKISKSVIENWRPKVVTGKRGVPYIDTDDSTGILTAVVSQDGGGGSKRTFPLSRATQTVLSSFNSVEFRHIFAVREEMKSWRFLQFNPDDLRKPSDKRTGDDIISSTGKDMAAALFRIKQSDSYNLIDISRKLNSFLPEFTKVDVIDDTENKQFVIQLTNKDNVNYSSRVLSEGTLRLLALCIMEFDDKHTGLLCFEEPENGIHPFRIKDMATLLKELSTDFDYVESPLRQVVVNTHSPILVNDIYRWKSDPNVCIWYMQMRTRITTINGIKVKINITTSVPVDKDDYPKQLVITSFSKEELKYTLSTVKQYLNAGSTQNDTNE